MSFIPSLVKYIQICKNILVTTSNCLFSVSSYVYLVSFVKLHAAREPFSGQHKALRLSSARPCLCWAGSGSQTTPWAELRQCWSLLLQLQLALLTLQTLQPTARSTLLFLFARNSCALLRVWPKPSCCRSRPQKNCMQTLPMIQRIDAVLRLSHCVEFGCFLWFCCLFVVCFRNCLSAVVGTAISCLLLVVVVCLRHHYHGS